MKTPLLTVSEAEKGMTIYRVSAWNFHIGFPRKDQHHRDERGRSVYTPYEKDIYSIWEWRVHSCGKKLLRICDDKGMRGTMGGYANSDGTFGFYVTSKELAVQLINELRSSDEYSTEDYTIQENRF